jgi:predicted nucleic acid-binding protein
LRRYLLDTTPLAAYLFGRPHAVALVGPWLDSHEAATSILVYGEIIEYLMGRSRFPDRQTQLRQLLREITPLFLSYSVLDRYALLRRELRPPHRPGLVGDIDGWKLRLFPGTLSTRTQQILQQGCDIRGPRAFGSVAGDQAEVISIDADQG